MPQMSWGDVVVRKRRPDDLEPLVAMARRVHEIDGYPRRRPRAGFATFLNRPTPIAAWVADRGEAVVGHVALNRETSPPVMRLVEGVEPPGPVVYVARLLVDPDHRGVGIGRQLLERARCRAVDDGCYPFLDVVDIQGAAPALALYRQAGWTEIGRVPFEAPDQADAGEIVFRGPPT